MAKPIIPEFPKVYFESDVPKKLGKLIAKKEWGAVTVCNLKDIQFPPNVKLPPMVRAIIDAITKMNLAPGVYFVNKKQSVKEKLAAHELFHWDSYRAQGATVYILNIAVQYAIFGYDNAPVEKNANAAGKKGLDTPAKKKWLAEA